MRPQDLLNDEQLRWFVVRTLPHKEKPASLRLKAQGYRTFLPTIDRTIRHARKISTVRRAFFPRYLFIQFDPTRTAWRAINGTIGVDRLVSSGDRPQPVRAGVVETMLNAVDGEDRLSLQDPLEAGDRVRLISGPFADQLGVVTQMRSSDRVQVLLSLLDAAVPLVTDRKHVALVGGR